MKIDVRGCFLAFHHNINAIHGILSLGFNTKKIQGLIFKEVRSSTPTPLSLLKFL
jgi:hypothetical protein